MTRKLLELNGSKEGLVESTNSAWKTVVVNSKKYSIGITTRTSIIGSSSSKQNSSKDLKGSKDYYYSTVELRSSSPSRSTWIERAYRESIEFLTEDSKLLKTRLKELKELTKNDRRDDDDDHHDDPSKASSIDLSSKIERLEILSEINDPQLRLPHSSSLRRRGNQLAIDDQQPIDMSKPIHRFLAQQNWRRAGRLGRLMETIHRLRVFPDLFPSIDPTVDLRIKFQRSNDEGGCGSEDLEERASDDFYRVNVGNFFPSSKSLSPPFVQVQAFHPDPKLYTIVMIDPDVPDPKNHTFTTFLHWLVPNISISATTNGPKDIMDQIRRSSVDRTQGLDSSVVEPISTSTSTSDRTSSQDRSTSRPRMVGVDYIPPHPARGSGIHRYTIMLLEQAHRIDPEALEDHFRRPSSTDRDDDDDPPPQRLGFCLRKFSQALELRPAGITTWISRWDARDADRIGSIYRDRLHLPEPRYGPEPKRPSTRTKLPSYASLPLTHRHPPVIPWRQHASISTSNPPKS